MNIYLTIITSVLVITQIIRVTQNAVSLHRQAKEVYENIEWIKERDVTQEDFDVQRECFYLLRERLKNMEELDGRPSCCVDHNVYGATCDNCEFGEVDGEVDGEVLQYLRDIGEVEE